MLFAACSSGSATSARIWNGGRFSTTPKEIGVSADAGYILTGLTWSDWGKATAHASGMRLAEDCIPDCARGKHPTYAITLAVSKLSEIKGVHAYAAMLVTYTNGDKDRLRMAAGSSYWELEPGYSKRP